MTDLTDAMRAYLRALGSKGGSARHAKRSPAELSRIGKLGAKARWGKSSPARRRK